MKYLFLLFMLPFAAHAGEVCTTCSQATVPALQGPVIYEPGGNDYAVTDTRTMSIPEGYKMTRVQHEPVYHCTEYPQPDTFEIRAITPPVETVIYAGPAKVTQEEEDALNAFLEGQR